MRIMGHHGMARRCSLLLDPGPAFAMCWPLPVLCGRPWTRAHRFKEHWLICMSRAGQ